MALPKVVFVLGGPGAGKGTACSYMVEKFGMVHLSAGDLLRAERNRSGSEYGELIQNYIKDGLIVPIAITCKLIENAMNKSIQDSNGEKDVFLIDGFPRNEDNLTGWKTEMGEKSDVRFCLYLNCPLKVCEERIMERSKTSGRTDDNLESLRKRFATYEEQTKPVIEKFRSASMLHEVDSTVPAADVAAAVSKIIEADSLLVKK